MLKRCSFTPQPLTAQEDYRMQGRELSGRATETVDSLIAPPPMPGTGMPLDFDWVGGKMTSMNLLAMSIMDFLENGAYGGQTERRRTGLERACP